MPNVVLITADDMNWDAVGACGCPVPGTTPQIDRLAAGGLVIDHAHVTIAVCQPSRSVLMTGRYPHNSGGEGFFNLRQAGVPILPDLLRAGGYAVGILGKYGHSTPYPNFRWDHMVDMDKLGMGRDPDRYAEEAAAFLDQAGDQPFFLMYNTHDPHRPFHGSEQEAKQWADKKGTYPAPQRVFTADEVVTPGFLPDLPEVRREIAEYYSSVHRGDETIGRLLDLLDDRDLADDTLIIFLSDNGMAFPFAKTNCYLNSTRTPFIVRWPQRIAAGRHVTRRMVSGVDVAPTILDACGISRPDGMDGEGFIDLLDGAADGGHDLVFTQFHQTANKRNYPMRCVRGPRWGYIWNPWADGERSFRNESMAGRTFTAMEASDEPVANERAQFFLTRTPEELYDFSRDPHALENRLDDPLCADALQSLTTALEEWMVATGDPALEAFRKRHDQSACEALIADMATTIGGS